MSLLKYFSIQISGWAGHGIPFGDSAAGDPGDHCLKYDQINDHCLKCDQINDHCLKYDQINDHCLKYDQINDHCLKYDQINDQWTVSHIKYMILVITLKHNLISMWLVDHIIVIIWF